MGDGANPRQTVLTMSRARGFTLIELVITFALAAVLALVAVQTFGPQRQSATYSAAQVVLEQLAARQDLEHSTRGSYTADPDRLGEGVSGVEIVSGEAQDGQVAVGLGLLSGADAYGLAYRLGDRCHTLRAGVEEEPLFGSFDAAAVSCTAGTALQGPAQ